MPERDFVTEALQAKGIYGCVPGKTLLEDDYVNGYVAERERDVITGLKEQQNREAAIDVSEKKQIRELSQQKAEALAKGFEDSDPEVYTLQSKIAGLEESQRMSVHVRENLQEQIRVHSTLLENAENRLRHIQAVKSRGGKP